MDLSSTGMTREREVSWEKGEDFCDSLVLSALSAPGPFRCPLRSAIEKGQNMGNLNKC
jgi:hypothetical protein